MRIAIASVLVYARLASAETDPDEHGHGHRHKHPHGADPHHHHPHEHPHPPGQGHHHPFVVEPPPLPPPPHPAAAPPLAPELRDFQPRRGPPGARVTLTGARFARDSRVWYGGRPLATKFEGDSALVVQIPTDAKSDVFVVRQKGFPDAASAASFVVEAAPVIASITPATASPGDIVIVKGRHFLAGDRVLFGDRAADVLSATPERLEAVVPLGAGDCHPVVVRELAVATSPRAFRVVAPLPVISSIQPAAAASGATVRIVGKNFLPSDRVLLGSTTLPVQAHGPEFLDVTIPPAARSGEIQVIGTGRKARWETPLTIVLPPEVKSVEPAWATLGARVTIGGRHFVAGDVVRVGDRPAVDVTVSEDRIVFTVPPDAQTGSVAVVRGEAKATSRSPLEIVAPPVVEAFEPVGGPGGTLVTLRGRHLARDARVSYGPAALVPVARRPPGEIDVRIPKDAEAARFAVATRAGQAESAASFEIWTPASLTTFEPAFGQAGTQVVIRGRHFTPQDTVSLGGTDLPVQSAAGEALTVAIPVGARPGPFIVHSRGKELTTRSRFRVVAPPPPLVLTFAPISGPPGTEVALRTGRRFTGVDRVLLDGTALAKKLAASGAEVHVRIPAGARTGRFEVVTAGGERVVAEQPFQVEEKNRSPVSDKPGVY